MKRVCNLKHTKRLDYAHFEHEEIDSAADNMGRWWIIIETF